MKQFLTILTMTILLTSAIWCQPKSGSAAMLFDFHGLSNLALNEYGEGVGVRYHADDNSFVQGSFGLVSTTPEEGTKQTDFGFTAGWFKYLLGSSYTGVQFGYNTYVDNYTLSLPWGIEMNVKDAVNLGASYGLSFSAEDKKFVIGSAGSLYVSWYFN